MLIRRLDDDSVPAPAELARDGLAKLQVAGARGRGTGRGGDLDAARRRLSAGVPGRGRGSPALPARVAVALCEPNLPAQRRAPTTEEDRLVGKPDRPFRVDAAVIDHLCAAADQHISAGGGAAQPEVDPLAPRAVAGGKAA